MAITAVLDIAGYSAKPYIGKDMETTVPYIVRTDSASDTEVEIMAADVLPDRGDVHPENAYLAAYECSLRRNDKSPTMWHAVVTYKADSMDKKDSDRVFYPNPTTRPAGIEWGTIAYTIPAVKSVEDYIPPGETKVVKAGAIIVNSAWDRFNPPHEKTEFNWTVTVTKLVSAVPRQIRKTRGAVNSYPFRIEDEFVEPGCARIINMNIGSYQRENGYNYREMKYTMELREKRDSRFVGEVVPEPFILEIEDLGYSKRPTLFVSSYQAAGLGDLERILDDNGKPISDPCNLGNNGEKLANLTFTNAAFRCYKIYRTFDFSQLPLS